MNTYQRHVVINMSQGLKIAHKIVLGHEYKEITLWGSDLSHMNSPVLTCFHYSRRNLIFFALNKTRRRQKLNKALLGVNMACGCLLQQEQTWGIIVLTSAVSFNERNREIDEVMKAVSPYLYINHDIYLPPVTESFTYCHCRVSSPAF